MGPLFLVTRRIGVLEELRTSHVRQEHVTRRIGVLELRKKIRAAYTPNRRLRRIENFSCSSGTIEFLTTEMALRQEGLEMSHCIGSYRMRGFSGQSIMGSVKGNDGTRSSITFSGFFSIDHQERPLKEVFIEEENKSYGNSTPTGDVLNVVEQFKRTIPELRTKDYSVYINTTKEKKRNQRNLVLQNIVDNINDNMNDFALLFKKRDRAYTFVETLASIARILR